MKRTRVTGRDVAKAAGVSHNTVSLVVRDSPLVTPETKAKVRATIESLGYRPNDVAAVLRSAQSRTLGYLLPEDNADAELDVFRNQLLKAVTQSAEEHNYYVLLDLFSDAQHGLSLANSGRIDALLIDGRIPDDSLAELAACRLPLVLVGRDAGPLPINWVKADEETGAFEAVTHLITQGHRRIACITAGEVEHSIVRQRELGYRRALSTAGIPFDPALIMRADWTFESSFAHSHRLLATPDPPTGLFVVTEMMAAATLQVAQGLGLRIPDDIGIVTIGNSVWAQYVQPPLTVVQVPMTEVGTRATELLFHLIEEDNEEPYHVIVPTTLVIRSSSQRVAPAHAGV